MIDLHCHILPDIDDGPKTWEKSLEMARMAVAGGIRTVVATPHLFRHRSFELNGLNDKETILKKVREMVARLTEARIPLEVLAGCDFPLSSEALELLQEDRVLTINNSGRYLLLELPDLSLPPATEEICYALQCRGITPIITHPERHFLIQEAPEKLVRLLNLGCLAQITAGSLTGLFGRKIARLSKTLVQKGYINIVASDAHSTRVRTPELRKAVALLAKLIGKRAAMDMVTTIPAKILLGETLS